MADKPQRQKKGNAWTVAMVVAGVLLLWFAIANSTTVGVHFWVSSVSAPLIVVIALSAALGALMVVLYQRSRSRR
jgi:uncharacterized integral membrane protein